MKVSTKYVYLHSLLKPSGVLYLCNERTILLEYFGNLADLARPSGICSEKQK